MCVARSVSAGRAPIDGACPSSPSTFRAPPAKNHAQLVGARAPHGLATRSDARGRRPTAGRSWHQAETPARMTAVRLHTTAAGEHLKIELHSRLAPHTTQPSFAPPRPPSAPTQNLEGQLQRRAFTACPNRFSMLDAFGRVHDIWRQTKPPAKPSLLHDFVIQRSGFGTTAESVIRARQ